MAYEFNAAAITGPIRRGRVAAFKKAGAYIRRSARQSIKKSRKNSAPGEPPKAKSRKLKATITYAADTEGVVIGPERVAPANSTPAVLEYGGRRSSTIAAIQARVARTQDARHKPKPRPSKRRGKPGQKWTREKRDAIIMRRRARGEKVDDLTSAEEQRRVSFTIAPRPYMAPAFRKNKAAAVAAFRKLM